MKHLIIGYPGTGKTTYLANRVTTWLDDGTDPDVIGYTSFSRTAARAITDKLKTQRKWVTEYIGDEEFRRVFPYIATTHSICARLLGLREQNFVRSKHKHEFCKHFDIPYKPENDTEDEDITTTSEPTDTYGNLMFEYFQRMKRLGYEDGMAARKIDSLRHMNYKEEQHIPEYVKNDLRNIFETWEAWKQSRDLFEYEDMLFEVLHEEVAPQLDYFVIDEAHDVFPLQKKVFDFWIDMNRIEDVYVAIDKNQTLYEYNGANPHVFDDYFADPNSMKIILPKSYRLPAEILEEVKAVAKKLGDKDIEHVEPNGERGEVKEIPYEHVPDMVRKLEGSTFILFRYNRDIRQFLKENQDLMIEKKIKGIGRTQTSWNHDSIYRLCNFKYRWLAGYEVFPYPEVLEFITRTPSKYLLRGSKKRIKEYIPKPQSKKAKKEKTQKSLFEFEEKNEAEQENRNERRGVPQLRLAEVRSFFKYGDIPLFRILTDPKFKVTPLQRQIILETDEIVKKREADVEIGTIHASKALEAENVFLNMWEVEAWMDEKSELRVEYVGKSRSMKRLFIVS